MVLQFHYLLTAFDFPYLMLPAIAGAPFGVINFLGASCEIQTELLLFVSLVKSENLVDWISLSFTIPSGRCFNIPGTRSRTSSGANFQEYPLHS
ncbi:unnamed protein product [Caenorhabditis nigoni]